MAKRYDEGRSSHLEGILVHILVLCIVGVLYMEALDKVVIGIYYFTYLILVQHRGVQNKSMTESQTSARSFYMSTSSLHSHDQPTLLQLSAIDACAE